MFILNTASPWIIPERSTAPQHTRFILPPFHPTKSSLRCVSGIFLLREPYLENFMSRPNVIPTFRQRRCTNRGRNFVRSKRRSTYTSSGTSLLKLLRVFQVILLGRACPKPCSERTRRNCVKLTQFLPTAARTPHAYFKSNRFSDTPASAQERFSILWASWQCPPTPAGYALIRLQWCRWCWRECPATAGCCCP